MLVFDSPSAFEPAPAGTHPVRCSQLVDLGTTESNFDGQTRLRRRVRLVFEICDPELSAANGEPFAIARSFTLSLSERSALRPFLEGWRGQAFGNEAVKGFDLKTILGAPGLASVVHETRADGRTFANVKAVAKLPRGMSVSQLRDAPLYWDMSDPAKADWAAFGRLSSKTQEAIALTPEYAKLKAPKTINLAPPSPAAGAGSGFDDMPTEPDFDDAPAF